MRIDVTFLDTNTSETFFVKGSSCIVGRSINADVTIGRGELSRQHFRIDVEGDALYVTDLNSANGVNVNGQRLTPEKKTPYFLFQSLDILERVAFTISEFEDAKAQAAPEADGNTIGRPKEVSQQSRTIRINPSSPKTAKKNSRPYLVIGAATACLIFALLFFRNKAESDSKKSTPAITVVSPKIDSGDYKDLIRKSSCKSGDKICDELNLTRPWEGVLNDKGKLLVFVNLNDLTENTVHAVMKKIPETELQKLALARIATHPDLLQYSKDISAREIIIVGFKSIDEIVSPQAAILVDKTKVPELSYKTHEELFGEIFFHGRPKLYDKYLSKSLHFQRL
jgi:hypothetical protein